MRKHPTPAELVFYDIILKESGAHRYTWNRQKPLLHFIVDFYCFYLKLIVEIDGKIHDDQKEYDAMREQHLRNLGFTVIRFTNEEVCHRHRDVTHRLAQLIEKQKSLLSQRRETPPANAGGEG